MNIIIPMTGYGSRFVAAGYKDLKPFIPVMDIPIVEWIVKRMYPADINFHFCMQRRASEKRPFHA